MNFIIKLEVKDKNYELKLLNSCVNVQMQQN